MQRIAVLLFSHCVHRGCFFTISFLLNSEAERTRQWREYVYIQRMCIQNPYMGMWNIQGYFGNDNSFIVASSTQFPRFWVRFYYCHTSTDEVNLCYCTIIQWDEKDTRNYRKCDDSSGNTIFLRYVWGVEFNGADQITIYMFLDLLSFPGSERGVKVLKIYLNGNGSVDSILLV